MKICISGSTKFKDEILKISKILNENNISHFLPIMEFPKELETAEMTTKYVFEHFKKMRDSEIILVVNPNGYIGNSVKIEIGFAKGLGKRLIYIEKTNQPEPDCLADEFISIENIYKLKPNGKLL
jgi:hypothetical protein